MDRNFTSTFKEILVENDPVRDICVEMGGTIKGPIQAMMATKNIDDFRMGLTYPATLIDIMNEYMHLGFDDLGQYVKFDVYLSNPKRGAEINDSVESMGGSLIAEWYWNFGWIGLPLILVLVYYLIRYENRISQNAYRPVQFAIYVMFLHFILKWTRGYFYDVVWLCIYTYVAITILKRVLYGRNKNLNNL